MANETGNYPVLRDLAAPGFREANDAERLAKIFSNLRGQKIDLSGVLALDPQLTVLPHRPAGPARLCQAEQGRRQGKAWHQAQAHDEEAV